MQHLHVGSGLRYQILLHILHCEQVQKHMDMWNSTCFSSMSVYFWTCTMCKKSLRQIIDLGPLPTSMCLCHWDSKLLWWVLCTVPDVCTVQHPYLQWWQGWNLQASESVAWGIWFMPHFFACCVSQKAQEHPRIARVFARCVSWKKTRTFQNFTRNANCAKTGDKLEIWYL